MKHLVCHHPILVQIRRRRRSPHADIDARAPMGYPSTHRFVSARPDCDRQMLDWKSPQITADRDGGAADPLDRIGAGKGDARIHLDLNCRAANLQGVAGGRRDTWRARAQGQAEQQRKKGSLQGRGLGLGADFPNNFFSINQSRENTPGPKAKTTMAASMKRNGVAVTNLSGSLKIALTESISAVK